MSSMYPANIDTLTAPTATSTITGHGALHGDMSDAVNKIETKLGVDSSAVTSSIDYKINHLTASSITDITASADEINVLDGIPATLTATELGYVDGVTSAIQTQLGDKAPLASPTFTGTVTMPVALSGIAKLTSGVVSAVTAPSGTIVGTTDTQTLSAKRITQRVVTTTDDATAVIDVDVTDQYQLSAVANATEFTVTGTPTDGQKLIIRIKDAGVAKGLTFTGFTAVGVTIPTTTVASKWTYVGCVYNLAATTWHVIAVAKEA